MAYTISDDCISSAHVRLNAPSALLQKATESMKSMQMLAFHAELAKAFALSAHLTRLNLL